MLWYKKDYSKIKSVKDCYGGTLNDFCFFCNNRRIAKRIKKLIADKNRSLPVLIYGRSGSGKSFLADCICREMRKKGKTAVRLTCEQFQGEVMNGILNEEGTKTWSRRYFRYHMVVIDEIEEIRNKKGMQRKMGEFVRDLSEHGVQTVLLSLFPDEEFSTLCNAVKSKLVSYRLEPLTLWERRKYLYSVLRHSGLRIPLKEYFLISRQENMGILKGMIDCLLASTVKEREDGIYRINSNRMHMILGPGYRMD